MGCKPECYEWADANGWNFDVKDNCVGCKAGMKYYASEHMCAEPGLSSVELFRIKEQLYRDCGDDIFNPRTSENTRVLGPEDMPVREPETGDNNILPGIPPAPPQPEAPAPTPDENMPDEIDAIIGEPPAKRPRPEAPVGAPGGTGGSTYDPCRTYTEEEKKEYYKKKCQARQWCKSQGYGYKKPTYKKKWNSKKSGSKSKSCSCK